LEEKRSAPDFICIGAQKGGTRWLYDQLQHHPDFWMPPIKELDYLAGKPRIAEAVALRRGIRTWRWLVNLQRKQRYQRALGDADAQFLDAFIRLKGSDFDLDGYGNIFAASRGAITGDISPNYSLLDDARVTRIAERFAALRVVFIAREPIERFWSHYAMHLRKAGRARAPNLRRIRRFLKGSARRHSRPTEIAERWRRAFGDRFQLFLFDDLKSDPEDLRARILGFLGADPGKPSAGLAVGFNSKSGRPKPAMPDDVRAFLVESLEAEIRSAASVFGGAAEDWPARYGLSRR
jgi:hypothetical protein